MSANGPVQHNGIHHSPPTLEAATNPPPNSTPDGSTPTRRQYPKDPSEIPRLLGMPPVVGSNVQFANKTLKYRPFPPNLNAVRQKLYLVERPILLDSQAIADYWPHMSNVWLKSSSSARNENGCVTEAWECRVRRRVATKGEASVGKGLRQRNSKDRLIDDVDECKMRIRLVTYTKHSETSTDPECAKPGFGRCKCVPEWLHISRTRQAHGDIQHTHEIGLLDTWSRSNAILYFAKGKVEGGGFGYTAVQKWLQEKYGGVCDQAQYLTHADVANVSRPWRLKNKDVALRSGGMDDDESEGEAKMRDCLDRIMETGVDGLRNALKEVCKKMPEAVDVILPFLGKKGDDGSSASVGILEGGDIVMPEPGLPSRRQGNWDELGNQPPLISSILNDGRMYPLTITPSQQPQTSRQPSQPNNPTTAGASSQATPPGASRSGQSGAPPPPNGLPMNYAQNHSQSIPGPQKTYPPPPPHDQHGRSLPGTQPQPQYQRHRHPPPNPYAPNRPNPPMHHGLPPPQHHAYQPPVSQARQQQHPPTHSQSHVPQQAPRPPPSDVAQRGSLPAGALPWFTHAAPSPSTIEDPRPTKRQRRPSWAGGRIGSTAESATDTQSGDRERRVSAISVAGARRDGEANDVLNDELRRDRAPSEQVVVKEETLEHHGSADDDVEARLREELG
ncbi:unnamed protein product [Zymoseptoria tritici ST99CH_3D1]|nr:unnamed protein product [Zymoseptoria tritici ST99CH_3D1]